MSMGHGQGGGRRSADRDENAFLPEQRPRASQTGQAVRCGLRAPSLCPAHRQGRAAGTPRPRRDPYRTGHFGVRRHLGGMCR